MKKLNSPEAFDELLALSGATMEVRSGAPVRKIFNGRRHRPVGLYPSAKNDQMVAWESRLERRTLRWLEVDPSVIRFLEQPHHLRFPFMGRTTRYTPDFSVTTAVGTYYIEVKYRRDLFRMEPDDRARLKRARSLYRQAGSDLVFVTDLRFKTNARWHDNAQLVEDARRAHANRDEIAALVSHLEERQESTIGDCSLAIDDAVDGLNKILALMIRRLVSVNLNETVGPQTSVSLTPDYASVLAAVAVRAR